MFHRPVGWGIFSALTIGGMTNTASSPTVTSSPAITSSPAERRFGHQIIEHKLQVPWEPSDPHGETFELFAREIVPDGGENYPAIVYLQGGPGFPAPRPLSASGVLGWGLGKFRWILLDQRGTGRSHRIDAQSPAEDLCVARLSRLRQEYIVHDAEALRRALGIDKWALFGQSFGGFCITTYLSMFPESVTRAYLTGGLPAVTAPVDDVYRATYTTLARRHEEFFHQVPWAADRIREIAYHLDNSEEVLPTGERLSSRRFRTIGIDLGRGDGFLSLAYALEDPFRVVRGEKRLKTDFLSHVGAAVSFAAAPLYAAIHESIYGGVGQMVARDSATRWSAHRIRAEIPGFEEEADPRSAEKYYLTGEHIYPWQFEEDPALRPLAAVAEELAQHQWQHSPYNPEVLGSAATPVCAAAVYVDDIFVPFEFSMDTARKFRDLRPHITNYFQHDGIRHDGAGLAEILDEKIADH